MTPLQIISHNRDIFSLADDFAIYRQEWNEQEQNHVFKIYATATLEYRKDEKIKSIISINREIYGLSTKGNIYTLNAVNLNKGVWQIYQECKFKEDSTLQVKQIITEKLILASDNKIYERSWEHYYFWRKLGKPTSYITSLIF